MMDLKSYPWKNATWQELNSHFYHLDKGGKGYECI